MLLHPQGGVIVLSVQKIAFLKDLGAHLWQLETVLLEKQRGYAQALQARRPAKTRELNESTLVIEVVFFLRVALLELTDSVIYQAGRGVSDLVRQAYDRTQARQARSSVEYRDRLVASHLSSTVQPPCDAAKRGA